MAKPNNIDNAVRHFRSAYDELNSAGLSEKFFSLAVDVGTPRWGRFFGKFGGDKGCFIEIEKNDTPGEMIVRFGVRRYRQSLWQRVKELWKETWNIVLGRDTAFEIHLDEEQITKLKDILRGL